MTVTLHDGVFQPIGLFCNVTQNKHVWQGCPANSLSGSLVVDDTDDDADDDDDMKRWCDGAPLQHHPSRSTSTLRGLRLITPHLRHQYT